ncbi:hypothetical protein ILYODFUR_030354 [Ilyodon furcidens]|uniref:Prolactin receptor n=1 Tax=Ilyodon furcidens TaxID=33524 RepID=A0ABV0T4V7_9TELE
MSAKPTKEVIVQQTSKLSLEDEGEPSHSIDRGPRGNLVHCQLGQRVDSSFPWLATDASLCMLKETGRTHHPCSVKLS